MAFEPIEELAEKIRKNVSLNNLGNVEVVAAAAAGQAGHAEFRYSEDHATQGMLQDTEPTYSLSEAKTVRVQMVTLDEIAQREGLWPDVMKVDVEGGAKSVFSGAQRVLDRAPDILIEQHGPEEQYAVKTNLSPVAARHGRWRDIGSRTRPKGGTTRCGARNDKLLPGTSGPDNTRLSVTETGSH